MWVEGIIIYLCWVALVIIEVVKSCQNVMVLITFSGMTSVLLPASHYAEIGPVLLAPKTCVPQPFYASLIIEWVEINKIRGLQVSPSHPNRIYDLDFIFKAASQRPTIPCDLSNE